MPVLEIEINDRELADLLRTLKRLDMESLIPQVFRAAGTTIQSKASVYPPAPEGSSYRRTRNLFNRWYRRVFPTYLEIGNLAEYAGWVHGEEQVEIHKQTGWKRLLQVATDELPEIIRKLEVQIERIWAGRG